MSLRGLSPASPRRRLLAEANNLASLLEAAARGLQHRRHQKHIRPARTKIKDIMAQFFGRQKAAIVKAVKPHIELALHADPPPLKEASGSGKRFASAAMPVSLSPLKFAASSAEQSEYDQAITGAIVGAGKTLAAELGAKGTELPESVAGHYLRDNSLSKLTGGLDNTTIDRLQNAIADAWDNGGSFDQIVKAIEDTMEDFSATRAELIAQTEANDAYSAGRRSMADQLDMDEHAWETESGDPCEECLANEAQGWIPVDEAFDSGDLSPTAHPGCECTENFRKSSEDEE